MKKILIIGKFFLMSIFIEKFPVLLIVHNHIRLFFAIRFFLKQKILLFFIIF